MISLCHSPQRTASEENIEEMKFLVISIVTSKKKMLGSKNDPNQMYYIINKYFFNILAIK